ncbi:hypothetical protein ACNAN0_08175 [Agrilactobacillus fermenti]|uniref:hypothetical protein n=1 Tax=Agrilactobacillus fermenti TaxID=2586909 RepID=UPI003A5BD13B
MKATKLFVSIVQYFIAVFIVFQTYSAWSQSITTDSSQKIVYTAFTISACYLISGIINMVYYRSESFIPEVIYFIFMFVGWFSARNDTVLYNFLNVWAWLGLLLGVGFLLWHIIKVVFTDAGNQPDKKNTRHRRGGLTTDPASEAFEPDQSAAYLNQRPQPPLSRQPGQNYRQPQPLRNQQLPPRQANADFVPTNQLPPRNPNLRSAPMPDNPMVQPTRSSMTETPTRESRRQRHQKSGNSRRKRR